MARIAILGVGAIGGVVAACLHGHELLGCSRRPFDALVIDHEDASHRVALRLAFDPASVEGPAEIVFVATKAHQTASAAPWLAHLVSARSVVVVLQNGVEQRERVAPWVAEEATILPVVVDLPATHPEPGKVVLRRKGTLHFPDEPASRKVVALFSEAPFLTAAIANDFAQAMWRKLCVNVVSGAIPALTDRPAGVFRDPAVAEVARGLVRECAAVARAEGISLPADLAETIVEGFASAPPDRLNAMLLDRRAGLLLEADARHGAVVRYGARHEIATPLNAMANAILSAINAT